MTLHDAAAALSKALHAQEKQDALSFGVLNALDDLDAALCTEGADACIDCGVSIHDHTVDGDRLVHPRAPSPDADANKEGR